MIRCDQCGATAPEGNRFCGKCGNALQQAKGVDDTPLDTDGLDETLDTGDEDLPKTLKQRLSAITPLSGNAVEAEAEPAPPKPPHEPATPPEVRLKVTAGPLAGREFVFNGHDAFLFGRSSSCHASLPGDGYVSRHHFLLEVNPPQAALRDLGSLNGTYVNRLRYGGRNHGESPEQARERLHQEVPVKNGDEIHIGATAITVEVSGGAAREEPPPQAAPSPEPAAQEPIAAGTGQFKDYVLGDEIGRGGLGVVFRAERKQDGLPAAIKVMRARGEVNEHSRVRFRREMAAVRKLDHPHIVRYLDQGRAGVHFWFAMELCEGGNMLDLVKAAAGPVALPHALAIMLPVLDALAHAHELGLVHRDIKPQNVLLAQAGNPTSARLGDFGLAKSFSNAGLSGLTMTSDHAGTYAFMPAEQVTNFKYVKPVSDVWSAAATLYFLLTGRYPRRMEPGMDPVQVVLEQRPVPIAETGAAIPAAVARVMDQALSMSTQSRFRTAGAFAAALRSACSGNAASG